MPIVFVLHLAGQKVNIGLESFFYFRLFLWSLTDFFAIFNVMNGFIEVYRVFLGVFIWKIGGNGFCGPTKKTRPFVVF
jgi:hypothetical protein